MNKSGRILSYYLDYIEISIAIIITAMLKSSNFLLLPHLKNIDDCLDLLIYTRFFSTSVKPILSII